MRKGSKILEVAWRRLERTSDTKREVSKVNVDLVLGHVLPGSRRQEATSLRSNIGRRKIWFAPQALRG